MNKELISLTQIPRRPPRFTNFLMLRKRCAKRTLSLFKFFFIFGFYKKDFNYRSKCTNSPVNQKHIFHIRQRCHLHGRNRQLHEGTHIYLLYTNRQSSPFHVLYWWRAYHVRLTKLDCLPRISARGRQCIIHR